MHPIVAAPATNKVPVTDAADHVVTAERDDHVPAMRTAGFDPVVRRRTTLGGVLAEARFREARTR